jgi:hypothetical protein
VGLRSTWTCVLCKRTALNFQLVRVDSISLAPPRGWFLMTPGGWMNCGGHGELAGETEIPFAEGAD